MGVRMFHFRNYMTDLDEIWHWGFNICCCCQPNLIRIYTGTTLHLIHQFSKKKKGTTYIWQDIVPVRHHVQTGSKALPDSFTGIMIIGAHFSGSKSDQSPLPSRIFPNAKSVVISTPPTYFIGEEGAYSQRHCYLYPKIPNPFLNHCI